MISSFALASDIIPIVPTPKKWEQASKNIEKLPAVWNVYGEGDVAKSWKSYQDILNYWYPNIVFRFCEAPQEAQLLLIQKEENSPESYVLNITEDNNQALVMLEFSDRSGGLYGLLSLAQLIHESKKAQIPLAVTKIQDQPSLAWRGLMLDVSRHFFTVDQIKQLMDAMALMKLNKLHLHLTDGPGWRFEVPNYPNLTKQGAWRFPTNKEWDWQNLQFPKSEDLTGANYGGFYTQKDLSELVNYAQSRGITLVPEIDLPGHSFAAMLSYPEIRCEPNDFERKGQRGEDVICVSRPESLKMMKEALQVLMNVLPKGSFIHLGGDEVVPISWKQCRHCQEAMQKHGLNRVKDLQTLFMQELCDFVIEQGYQPIVWDECLELKPLKDATVMIWRDKKLMDKSFEQHKNVILCPCSDLYFDYYQADPSQEPKAIGGLIPLKQVFDFTWNELSPKTDSTAHLLGIQANVWTEYLKSWDQVNYMIWPRAIALAERAWSGPRSKDSFESFYPKIQNIIQRLESKSYRFRPLDSPPKSAAPQSVE